MKLVIAEKPSVLVAIASDVGANIQKNGYWEGNGYIVTCVNKSEQIFHDIDVTEVFLAVGNKSFQVLKKITETKFIEKKTSGELLLNLREKYLKNKNNPNNTYFSKREDTIQIYRK